MTNSTGKAFEDADRDDAVAQVGDRFVAVIRELRRNRHNRALQRGVYLIGDIELTPVQVDILETVVGRPSMRMSEIAVALGVDASTASRTLAPLVELGLIERRSEPTDKRLIIIQATSSGRAHADRIAEARRALMRAVFDRMAPGRITVLVDLLEDYMEAVEAEATSRDAPIIRPLA